MNARSTASVLSASAVLLIFVCACEPKIIPGTQIKDTPATRSLATLVLEKYRKAMEARDADTILSMVSPRFHEPGGTASPADDYNVDGLKKRLAEKFKKLQALTLDISLIDIAVDDEKGSATVKYHYFLKYLVQYPAEERWESQSEDAQMIFSLDKGEWKVMSGL